MKIRKGVEARTMNLKGLFSRSWNWNPGDFWFLAFIGIGSFPFSSGGSTRYKKSGTLIRTMLVNRSMTDEKMTAWYSVWLEVSNVEWTIVSCCFVLNSCIGFYINLSKGLINLVCLNYNSISKIYFYFANRIIHLIYFYVLNCLFIYFNWIITI